MFAIDVFNYLLEMKNTNKALFSSIPGPGSQLRQAVYTTQTFGQVFVSVETLVAWIFNVGFRCKSHWQLVMAQCLRKPERS